MRPNIQTNVFRRGSGDTAFRPVPIQFHEREMFLARVPNTCRRQLVGILDTLEHS